MHKKDRSSLELFLSSISLGLIMLSGCAAGSLRLYDETKSKMSAEVKEKYGQADVVGVIDVEKKNLDALHQEELQVVRDNLRLQLDLTLLELADNDSPMAETWQDEIETPIDALGFSNSGNLRKFLGGSDQVALRSAELERLRDRISTATSKPPQECTVGGALDSDLQFPPGLSQVVIDRAQDRYQIYKETCEKLKKAHGETELAEAGKVNKARRNWENAKKVLVDTKREADNAKKGVDKIAKDYEASVAKVREAGTRGDALRKTIKEKADALRSDLEKATKLAPQALSEERLSAILTLLKAAASEQTKVEDNAELAQAVLMVNGLSSLAGDVAGLIAEAKAPSVGNLLIELQHQTVLLEHAKAVETLQEQRVNILESKYAAYRSEAELLLTFRDALCSFAFRSENKTHPGDKCDEFSVVQDNKTWTCKFPGEDPIRDSDPNNKKCALFKPWKTFLSKPPQGDAGREFFKALASFTRIFPVRAFQIEQDFNLVDLQHRENLASREMALRAWNNLAAVPIDQLHAYYLSGLKPEAVADLIVKALGFTAITAGVSTGGHR